MKVIEFDTKKGMYRFAMQDFETTFHKHPAIEIIFADQGSFSIITKNRAYQDLSYGAIDANVEHRIIVPDCKIKLCMIEHHNRKCRAILNDQKLNFEDGIWFEKKPLQDSTIASAIEKRLQCIPTSKTDYDKRISDVVN